MPDYSNWNTVEVTYSLLCFILCSLPFPIGLLRFAKAEDERAAGTEWAKDHGHLSGNGPEALEMKGLTRPNQMVNISHVALVTYGDTHTIKYTAHSQPAENVVYSTSVPANFYMYN